jgi:hypothetical protein
MWLPKITSVGASTDGGSKNREKNALMATIHTITGSSATNLSHLVTLVN